MLSEKKTIPLSVPSLNGQEQVFIKECLDTNWVSYLGPFVDRFERILSESAGSKYAVAVSSGTAALHVALHLSGVGYHDEVVMPTLTFVAPANAVLYCGAFPVFTDVRMSDWQWDVDQLAEFLQKRCIWRKGKLKNRATGRRIAAIMPVHLLGGMCDVDAVSQLANRFNLPVIEDAAECLGATWMGRGIGAPSAALRHIVTTSFNGNKIVTTGGGGALLINDSELHARARHISTTAKADKFEFYHDEMGFNYRMTNVAAAMGVAQLASLEAHVTSKRKLAEFYKEKLKTLPVTLHPEPSNCRSIFWLYSILLAGDSRTIARSLNEEGIMARPFWVPMHMLPAFSNSYACAVNQAEQLYKRGLSLPSSAHLSSEDRERVVSTLARLLA